MYDMNSYDVVIFNSIVAKYIEDKRINYCKSNSYDDWNYGAVFSDNSSGKIFTETI